MATAFDDLAQKIPSGDMSGQDSTTPKVVTDYLGRQAPLAFSGQPALPSVAAPAPSAGPSSGGAGEKAATGLLKPATGLPGGAGGDVQESFLGGIGGGGSGAGPTADAVGGQGGFPSFSTQAGMFGLSGSPFGLTGTVGPPGGPQFGLTVGPGSLSPSFHSGNPQVDSLVGLAGKEGLAQAGLPSSVSASFLSALANAPQIVGLLGGLISAMGQPLSIASLAHSIASLSPTSVASLQAALADPNPEAPLSLEQALAIMSGGQMGPMSGGPQSAIGPGNIGGLGPSGAGFGTGGSTAPTAPASSLADMFSGGLFGGGPRANAFEDTGPPAAPPDVPDITATGDVGIGGAPTGEGAGGAPSAGDTGGSADAS